ncbi:MarR family transcriptional regulator [Limosilactobacillus vaginalis]|jgi:DNA-binding MarR family transcriptional regulator|uniref:MarR family transcriptional regulator n=2 Tax=Limosilactobacillus vaginalis TaxID=1633 RepID=A0AAP3GFG5_9LACO|nr:MULTISPECIES: MarR family transcriptional regulator [Limosilactobacillus]PEH04002.1 MarR family transcriptional regulator [Lactobacillus sp. UMNPBX5]EEJ40229.1 transcriptional regulator, MarR family [Limosilactobacillus vaginalis DSM 5837 = ATCC 49540]KRM48155.1 MarR family transcriptional regulator [Limosilactobacillus vaginalis DSM 5837 = ATCC 49540]MCI6852236.1 MarR family transcriptional regulator [Limosilactobacillus vaginalis]MCZ2466285.1 MarR family transcriptional regulator [Limosil
MIDILREVGMIERALDSISNIEFKDINLSNLQFLYVVRIYEHPGIIAEQLANLIKVDRTTLARAVRRLEKQGYVYRESDPDNKKIKHLYVTEKGKQIYPFIIRENSHSNEVALQGFTPEEAQQVHDYLKRIRQNIDADWKFVKRGGKRKY